MNYANNVTRPIGYDFADFASFPTDKEVYDAIKEKYSVIRDGISQPDNTKSLLGAQDSPIIGLNFGYGCEQFRLIVNNVRPIGKVKDKGKYLL